MSKIIITFAPHSTQRITVEQIDIRPDWIEVELRLDLYSPRVDISQLQISATFESQDPSRPETHQLTFPEPDLQPESTDEPFLISRVFRLRPDQDYTLFIEAFMSENLGGASESVLIHTPFPAKHYSSFVWDTSLEQWVPPVPKPGLLFQWSEERYQADEDPWVPLPEGEF